MIGMVRLFNAHKWATLEFVFEEWERNTSKLSSQFGSCKSLCASEKKKYLAWCLHPLSSSHFANHSSVLLRSRLA